MAHVPVLAQAQAPSPGDDLSLLLTAEGLLFAALAIGVSIQFVQGKYLPKIITKGGLALMIFLVITCVAVGAGASWDEIYRHSFSHRPAAALLVEGALAVVIAAQPVMAFLIWIGVR